jgi:GAF domain-containing protein
MSDDKFSQVTGPMAASRRRSAGKMLRKIDFLSDINKDYAAAMNYGSADRFIVAVLWWHLAFFAALAFTNSVLQLARHFPSPFAYRVISLPEAAGAMLIALAATLSSAWLRGKLKNHYAWRINTTLNLTAYSYLFVFISGGSIEMHFHFFIIMALLVVYADWRLGWIVLVLTALHHGILNYVEPQWVYFYGENDVSVIAHALPVLGTAIFTTRLCQNHRKSIQVAVEAKTELSQTFQGLEQRVAERTRDLTLAAEVSRSISQVRDVDALLADAVEVIRARFDLYHAQVYLADPQRQTLVLRAATGNAGKELLRLSHRLLIGPGSLNGRAAAEKRTVIVPDTAADPSFRSNALLPLTRSEMATPLIVGDHVVGVLDLQNTQPGALTADNLPAFETLAGQLAIAIQNARLFAQAEQARAEVEAQARRLAQAGWADFLDAVEHSEHIGYAFDANGLAPVEAPPAPAPDQPTLAAPILISGEPVGLIQLEGNVDQGWTDDEAEVVNAVARQVAQRVENLRLLAQAEQARAEVEAQARRLTREGWENYLQTASPSAGGYTYDLNQVSPLTAGADSSSPEIIQPLTVRGERIGEIEVEGVESLDTASAELVTTVAGQLSAHIENLRLAGQTQTALIDLAQRERVVSNVADTAVELLQRGPTAIADVLARLGKDADVSRVYIFENFIDREGLLCIRQTHEWAAEGIAPQIDNPELQHLPYATTLPRWPDILSRGELIRSLVRDLPATERELMESQDIRSILIIPMFAGKEFYGFVGFDDCVHDRAWDAYEINLLQTVSISIVNAITNARLLQQTEDALTQTRRRADREALVNEISQKIQSTLTVEGAMQTAIQELGRALRARRTAVELGAFVKAGDGK